MLTSKAGNSNELKAKNLNRPGFTLIELIVVLAVMGTVLFITLPKFRTLTFSDSSSKEFNILLNTIKELKKKAVSDYMDYILYLDPVKSVMWITSDIMAQEFINNGKMTGLMKKGAISMKKGAISRDVDKKHTTPKHTTPLPESLEVTGVEIYGLSNHTMQDEYSIRFSRQGYCDMALIHLKERKSEEETTIVIEPFLSYPEIRQEYITFDQCLK